MKNLPICGKDIFVFPKLGKNSFGFVAPIA